MNNSDNLKQENSNKHQDEQKINTSQIIPIEYPYAEKMLGEIKDVYVVENERENKIAAKASAFITVTLAVIALYIPMLPLDKLIEFFPNVNVNIVAKGLSIAFLSSLVLGFFFFGIAFYHFLKAYGVKGYQTVKVDDILKIASKTEIQKVSEGAVFQGIVAHYHQILRGTKDKTGNIEINTQSANNVSNGIRRLVIGFVIISISTIALRILVVIS